MAHPYVTHSTMLVESALARLYAASASPLHETESDEALDHLTQIAETMARSRAKHIADILTKIKVWRVIASEDALSYETATPDEALALSIIEDCERRWGIR